MRKKSIRSVFRMRPAILLAVAAALFLAACPALAAPKVVIVTIDAGSSKYLYLDKNGNPGGRPGNWLMPNVRRFLASGTWFENTKDYLPAATDMNHINAVSGGWVGEHGITQVSAVLYDWNADGTPNVVGPSLAFTKDGNGNPVDTLFNAYKRKYPLSKTFLISGKGWVANMFEEAQKPDLDFVISGEEHSKYPWLGITDPPAMYKFYDPPTDSNPILDDESTWQKLISLMCFEVDPASFPPDMWTVNTSLKLLSVEKPDLGLILLAQMDDQQHGLGAAWDTQYFERRWILGHGIVDVDVDNEYVYREAVLDGVRDVDYQFGRLVDGIRAIPEYKDAIIVLYSDHGAITYRNSDGLLDIFMKSQFDTNAANTDSNTDFMMIMDQNGLLTAAEKNFTGFMPILASSIGVLYWDRPTIEERAAHANVVKNVLRAHRVYDSHTGTWKCPWWIVTRDEMINGYRDPETGERVCLPGELWHKFYGPNNQPGSLHWPDMFIFMRDRWQMPSLSGMARNLGIQLPPRLAAWIAPVDILLGGHGSTDTQDIMMGFSGPGVAVARVVSDPGYTKNYRISDIAVTLAAKLGLTLQSRTVGQDRSLDIKLLLPR